MALSVEQWDTFPEVGSRRRSDWNRLALESGNIFATPEFVELWWQHFGSGTPVIVACRASVDSDVARMSDGGNRRSDETSEAGEPALQALWLLYRRGLGPLSVLRSMGHGCGDELSLVCRPESRAAAVDGLATFIGRRSPGVLVLLDLVRVDSPSEFADPPWRRLDATVLHEEPCPFLDDQQSGWETYLAGRSRNFRQQVRRRERQLADRHQVVFDLTESVETLALDLANLVELHERRFDAAESNAFTATRRRFHEDWARICLEQGWLRLWTLRLDGEPVAAWYGFRYAAVESFFQSGREPERAGDSVGFVLLAHTIRAALEDGLTEYRFLRGDEDYKRRFANGEYHVATVALPVGPAGRLAVRALSALISRRRTSRSG